MTKKILGLGNALTDVLFHIEDDTILEQLGLQRGGMQLVDYKKSKQIKEAMGELTSRMLTGGSASNTVHGISRLGLEVGFIGKIGKDAIGEFYESDCLTHKVTPFLIKAEGYSGHCTVLISPDSERTMCTFLGASAELSAEDIDVEVLRQFDMMHIEGYLVQNHQLLETATQLAKEQNMTVSLDMASFTVVNENRDFLKKIIHENIDIVFANEEEALAFTGKERDEAAIEIAKMCKIAVVNLGKDGSVICKDGKLFDISPRKVEKLIDTTGAGDMFAAGFLYGYAQGYDLQKCGDIGTLTAYRTVQNIGAKMSNEEWEQVYQILKGI